MQNIKYMKKFDTTINAISKSDNNNTNTINTNKSAHFDKKIFDDICDNCENNKHEIKKLNNNIENNKEINNFKNNRNL